MPQEQGYQSQVGPSAAPVAPLASPETYGAQVGAAITQVAQTVHQAQLREYEIQRKNTAESEWMDFQREFASQRKNADDSVTYARANAAPGGEGHANAMLKSWEAGKDAALSRITEDSVRQKAEAQYLDFGTRLYENEATWQEGKRVGKITGDFEESVAIASNRARHSPDDGSFALELKHAYAMVDGLQNVDSDTREKLRRYAEQSITIGYVNGLNDTNPAMAKAQIDAGLYDYLDPGQLAQLRSGADVEIRRNQATAEHEAAVAHAAFTEKVATAEQLHGQGVEIPDSDLTALHDQAIASGDTSTAAKIEGWQADNEFAKIYQGQTPVQRQNRIAELSRKKDRSAHEDRELKWAQGNSGGLDATYNSDPVGYLAKFGRGSAVPPPIDLADGGSLQVRAAAMRRQGVNAVFSDNELVPIREAVTGSDAGRNSVLQALDALDEGSRQIAARQIAPSDKSFEHEAQIPRSFRATIIAGKQAMAANEKFLSPDPKTPEGKAAGLLLKETGGTIAEALRQMSPEDVAAVNTIAGQWLAGQLTKQGRSVNSITRADVGTAMLIALGGNSGPDGRTPHGGIGRWSGSKAYVVPETMTESQFSGTVLRDAVAQSKRGVGPANPDGSWFDLKNAYPAIMQNGQYQWFTRSGAIVKRPDGRPFVSDLGQRP